MQRFLDWDLSSDGSDIANSTKANYNESESRHSRKNEYVPSKHKIARCSSPAKVKNTTNTNSIHLAAVVLSHKAAVPLMEAKCTAKANDDNIKDNSPCSIQSKSKTIGFKTSTDFKANTGLKTNTSTL